jgi:hypothetical protein
MSAIRRYCCELDLQVAADREKAAKIWAIGQGRSGGFAKTPTPVEFAKLATRPIFVSPLSAE